jgi:hypothetical protein
MVGDSISNSTSSNFILKMDGNANFIFAKKLNCNVSSINYDSDNALIVSGSFKGAVNFDTTASNFMMYSTNGNNLFICKAIINAIPVLIIFFSCKNFKNPLKCSANILNIIREYILNIKIIKFKL